MNFEFGNMSSTLDTEQAEMLIPLLQKITRQLQTTNGLTTSLLDESTCSTSQASSPIQEHCSTCIFGKENMDSTTAKSSYSLEELVRKKKKNAKSTVAQNFLHVRQNFGYVCIPARI